MALNFDLDSILRMNKKLRMKFRKMAGILFESLYNMGRD